MSELELKPCPFCGEKLQNIEKYRMLYQHPDNDCFFSELVVKQDEIEKWNTRKPMEKVVAELKEELGNAQMEYTLGRYNLDNDIGDKIIENYRQDMNEGKCFAFDIAIYKVRKGGVE